MKIMLKNYLLRKKNIMYWLFWSTYSNPAVHIHGGVQNTSYESLAISHEEISIAISKQLVKVYYYNKSEEDFTYMKIAKNFQIIHAGFYFFLLIPIYHKWHYRSASG